jgi:hypothetical protein
VRRAGSWSKDSGAFGTDVSASERDEDEDNEKGARKRKAGDKVRGSGARPKSNARRERGGKMMRNGLLLICAMITVCFLSHSHTAALHQEQI